jgi:ABC-type transport system involved in cytochrome bd biosynthesis fused ATPase/permease subunit
LLSTIAVHWCVFCLLAVHSRQCACSNVSYSQSADLDALRSQIGIIPQDPAMFAGTLRENIDPFERYSDSEVSVAIAECGLEHRSMDSIVGVSGENFSLGEKQLVSCALDLRCAKIRYESQLSLLNHTHRCVWLGLF